MDQQGKSGPCATDSTLLGKLKLALVVTEFHILEFKTGVRKREKKHAGDFTGRCFSISYEKKSDMIRNKNSEVTNKRKQTS